MYYHTLLPLLLPITYLQSVKVTLKGFIASYKREKPTFSKFFKDFYQMLRRLWFIFLAITLAVVSFFLTTNSQEPLFCYGVAFIGYSVASVLALVAVFGD